MGRSEKNGSTLTLTASSSPVSLIKRQPSIKRISRGLQLKNVDKTLQCSGKYSKHLVGKAKAEQSFDPLLYAENLTLLDRKNISSAYAEYVNSFNTTNDKRYLKNDTFIRQVVPLRDVAGTSIMSEDQVQKAQTLKTRPLSSDFLFSVLKCSDDSLIQALAVREKFNAMKSISTIIHSFAHVIPKVLIYPVILIMRRVYVTSSLAIRLRNEIGFTYLLVVSALNPVNRILGL
ncbi:uncharacterized protein LOC111518611 isoform X1 [Drosophila willistoni]|uniref:uncharacterized protein LOC111518611 isoform X1 n=1 Tax=Drosophila willistoni TaxID=7260 RepID=UPI000C26CFD5|nr:uncharacterized protein LOC111518611 isoform X1 [Drosophila willistoni]